jgi:Dolichyl-phosphate-mannose-protein mannosyltransferase
MFRKRFDLRSIFSRSYFAGGVALLGGLVYSLQNILYVFGQTSELDEGAYLYQGYLFVKGVYHPFQANGPWMYNAPLSYLIWGYLQEWFGPGLRTGRYFTILFGALMLVAVWAAARRLAGKWWAALAVWALALDPAAIKLYSLAISQILIACMLAVCLALVLGERRPLWQVVSGAVLAGVILLTRHNLAAVLPYYLIYVFWQHGKRAGVWAFASGLLTVVLGHLIYWPGILQIWAPWLPAKLTPFLDAFRPPLEGSALLYPTILRDQLLSLTSGLRLQFVPLAGSIAALILWPRRADWKRPSSYRAGVFLAALFFTLLILHLWASLFNNFCVYCVSPYVAFFSVAAVLLAATVFSQGVKKAPLLRQSLALVFILLLLVGIGYASFETTGIWLINLRVPRLKTLILTGGPPQSYAIWDILESTFHLGYQAARRAAPAMAGFLIALALLLATWIAWRVYSRRAGYDWMPVALAAVLGLGTLLSPTPVMAGASQTYDCQADNLQAYERVGSYLAGAIPPGSKVYWDGGSSIAPLIYVPGIEILPGQIYNFWSFSPDADAARVLKFGLWNQATADQWKGTADFILIAADRYDAKWDQYFHSTPGYAELDPSPRTNPCSAGSAVRIFRRKP